MVELIFKGVDVLDKQKLVVLSPLVLYLNFLVLVHNKGLVKEIDLGFLRIVDLLPNSFLIFTVTDSLYQFCLQFLLAHWVLALKFEPFKGIFGFVLFVAGCETFGEVVVDLNVDFFPVLVYGFLEVGCYQFESLLGGLCLSPILFIY